ncbi:hypothetical protein GCK72_020068 [Caenorhabditis remanei]|uniref:G-protein coupled receptors family 1 profile domain-containing protein n=1 Tax=Caenorhabditis remanei TaxID=31234 RepID=A0A6A5GG03_CAERE|nr:hypothetical protein GCK72_020068 [Caenorhabditis remanei]KAF1753511.1 hypothetical protein GCK72_020068 [Caenorhabditis remanei]
MKSFVFQNYPEYLKDFQALPEFDIYLKNAEYFVLATICLIVLTLAFSFFILIISDIFKLMSYLKLQISSVNFKKHKEAVRSLFVQSTTCILCLSPVCLIAAMAIFEFRYSQFLGELCIAWFAAQSSVNTVALLIFFAPYREFAAQYIPV